MSYSQWNEDELFILPFFKDFRGSFLDIGAFLVDKASVWHY
jgi:hypothetical protein